MREKKEINIQIGEQIRAAREQAKLTQEQFAERIDVTPQYISDLERGVVGISIATLKRACIALGTCSDKILFGHSVEARSSVIEKRCSHLTDREFSALLEIIENFCTALENARSNK